MSKSALGDTVILNETNRVNNDKGQSQLRYTLPSGRVVTSEWIPQDLLKGKVFIQWCGVVRDQDEYDIAEREAAEQAAIAAKQTRRALSPAPSTEHVPVQLESSNSSRLGSEDTFVVTSPASSTPSWTSSAQPQPRLSDLPDDPSDLIAPKLRALRIQLAQVQDQLSELSLQETRIKSSIARWEAVAGSLTEPSVEQQSAPSERRPPGPRELGGAPMPLIYVPSES